MLKLAATALFAASLFSLVPACAAEDDTSSDLANFGEDLTSYRPTYEVWSTGSSWYFHFKAANGQILLTSQGYSSRQAALNGLVAARDSGLISSRYAINLGGNGQYYVNLKAANGAVLETSEGYSTKSNASAAVTTMVADDQEYVDLWKNATGLRYQTFGSAGAYHWNLYAGNGQVVLSSESYTTEASSLNGELAAHDRGGVSTNYQILQAQDGRWYFVLKASNGQVIGTSQMYSTKSAATTARDSVVTTSQTAPIF